MGKVVSLDAYRAKKKGVKAAVRALAKTNPSVIRHLGISLVKLKKDYELALEQKLTPREFSELFLFSMEYNKQNGVTVPPGPDPDKPKTKRIFPKKPAA